MRVVCIDTGDHGFISIGKVYDVLDIHYSDRYVEKRVKEYHIRNDNGSTFCYGYWHFVTLKEYRKQKLYKLNGL